MNRVAASNIIKKEFTGNNAFEVIEGIISPALKSIGQKWEKGDVSLSEEYMASKIAEGIVDSLLPPEDMERKTKPIIAITTLGDEHMLGKRIVIASLRASGYTILDYGTSAPDVVTRKVKEDNVQILMASTLMLNFAMEVKRLRQMFTDEGLKTKIIVGGAPFHFDANLWKEIGADAMAKDAAEALDKVKEVMEMAV